MNLSELLTLLIILMGGYFLSSFIGNYYGIAGYIIGFIIGCMVFLLIYTFIRYVYFLKIKWNPPYYPNCSNPNCQINSINKLRGKDSYEVIESTPNGIIFRCACGAKYYFTGSRFLEILNNGKYRAYMRKGSLTIFWERDEK